MKSILRLILGSLYNPTKEIYFQINKIVFKLLMKKGTLVYLGLNTEKASRIYYKYENVIGFEPNPKNFSMLKSITKNRCVFLCAVSDKEGEFDFYLPTNKNNDASASLSDFTSARGEISSRESIKVKTVVLGKILQDLKIDFIDKYISDIEGYDFTVLKTLQGYLNKKKIKELQLEAFQNHVSNPYVSVTNYEHEFDELLGDNYSKIARGWGILKPGEFHDFRPDHFSIDLLYKLK